MSPAPVTTVGCAFEGYCNACSKMVRGKMIAGASERSIEGKDICVDGSPGRGDCGHSCVAVGGSAVWKIDGLPVVRKGDRVTGGIDGLIIEGSDFVNSD